MAAPSGTVWGDIVTGDSSGRKGRLGIYISVSSNNTQTTVSVQVWFWTIYSCDDGAANALYYDVGTSISSASTVAKSNIYIDHTIETGEGWNTANQTCLLTKTHTYNRGTSAATYKIYSKFSGIDMLGGTVYANTSFTVPKLTSYTIAYNANGGSGAPSSQTKYYGKELTLSSTKPTRTGYTFSKWNTESDGSGTSYSSGGSYTANSAATLYAIWTEHKLTVNYYSNYANYGTYQGESLSVSANSNIQVATSNFLYDNAYNNGLSNIQNSEYLYLSRTGYTPTGYWGTSTSGGTLVDQNTSFSTGQALAQALGKNIANGDASINIYPQWEINTYTIVYNANGGSGNMSNQSVNWNSDFVLSNNAFKREGYKFIGWNVYRNDDSTWYVVGQGWLTEDEIVANGYEKKLYPNQDELTFNNSWIKGNEDSISRYTMYAVWEISGVIYIDNGTALEPYLAYIDNGSSWDLYLAYVDDGANWTIIS